MNRLVDDVLNAHDDETMDRAMAALNRQAGTEQKGTK